MELLTSYILEFSSNRDVIAQLLSNVSEEQVYWKRLPDKWSLLEIICHLYDEERDDFRARVASVLKDPQQDFVPIDPPGWVLTHKYAEQDFHEMLSKFKEERNKSIEWLHTLSHTNWDNTYWHPKIGPMSAKFMIANWLAHDYLHIRQILRTKYEFLHHISGESLNYAGDW